MFKRGDPKPGETLTVPNVNSHVEQTPEIPAEIPNDAGPSEVHSHRSAPASEDKHDGQVLIGEGVKINGEIRECQKIEIHGTVEGDLEAEVLIVHGKGLLKGNVKTDIAEVHGSIDGDVSVKNLLDVKAQGSVTGKIKYGELSVETGGRIVGTFSYSSATSQSPTTDTILTGSKTATNPSQDSWYV